jgi:ABC-type multidrug transport system fused ATPase/permease subunit
MNGLVHSVPSLAGAMGCFRRIGEFLSSAEQADFRVFEPCHSSTIPLQNMPADMTASSESIDVKTRFMSPLSNEEPAQGQPLIQITEGSFGWGKGDSVLKDLNITFPKGGLTFVIGPVASGKSALCKTLLGETRALKGTVRIFSASKEIAFCDQTPHLSYNTIKENIVGFSNLDAVWYEAVLEACALTGDVMGMPKQSDTLVGSGGISLSGGQRQRVALARALYARKSILILDDTFSGLDSSTAQHIFQAVISPHGLAQKHGTTIIFATNAVEFLPFADHIIALGSDGRVAQQGPHETFRMQPGYVSSLAFENGRRDQEISVTDDTGTTKMAKTEGKDDLTRQLGDYGIYRYYFGAAGLLSTVVMLAFGISFSISFNLSTLWLKLWTDANSKSHAVDNGMYLGVYGALQCLSVILFVLLTYRILISVVNKTGINLHSNLLETVANASFTVFSTIDKGSIMNRFSHDIQLVDMQLPVGLVSLVSCTCVGAGQRILAVVSSPWIGLTLPVILTVFYFVQKFYLRTSRQLRLLELEAKSPLYTNFSETLNGNATIRAFGWTNRNLAHNQTLLDLSQKPSYLLHMVQRWLTFVIDMVVACIAVIVATLAITQRASGGFTGVALTQIMLMNLTIRGVILAWTEVETSIGAVTRIKGFGENTPLEQEPLEQGHLAVDWPQKGKVEFAEVSAAYDTALNKTALVNLNLKIQPGEKVGICGRTGSGKSSLVLALLRMLEIQRGSIKIDDVDLRQIPCRTIRERLNVLPQSPLIIPGTVRSNLDPNGENNTTLMIEALRKTQLWPIFEATGGLDSPVSGEILSHGQRQLFCLAAAIVKRSKVVILDEATSKYVMFTSLLSRSLVLRLIFLFNSVDHGTDGLMQRIIRDEFKGRTVIVITRRLYTILDFDRVGVMDHGVIRELDSPGALLGRDSMFRDMYREKRSS